MGGWLAGPELNGAVLFQDDFNAGIPGWTAVQPPGAYLDGPLQWQYDIVSEAFVEQSNVYTDNPTYSPTAVAPMLINDTLGTPPFTFKRPADGRGMMTGLAHLWLSKTRRRSYRVTFARQARTGFPWKGWSVDRKAGGVTSNLFGAGTPGYVQTFVNTAGRRSMSPLRGCLNRLTLGVVDNPTGTPTVYALVTDQPLPGPACGRVGLMTWGMAGGTPKGSGFKMST